MRKAILCFLLIFMILTPIESINVIDSALSDSSISIIQTNIQSCLDIPFELLDKGPWSDINNRRELVIDNQDDWVSFWNDLKGTDSPLPEMNFTEDVVIAVTMGMCRSGGYGIRIERIEHDNDGYTVFVHESFPQEGLLYPAVITNPYYIVKIPATDEEIQFEFTTPPQVSLNGLRNGAFVSSEDFVNISVSSRNELDSVLYHWDDSPYNNSWWYTSPLIRL